MVPPVGEQEGFPSRLDRQDDRCVKTAHHAATGHDVAKKLRSGPGPKGEDPDTLAGVSLPPRRSASLPP
jgi:hypothetical protein